MREAGLIATLPPMLVFVLTLALSHRLMMGGVFDAFRRSIATGSPLDRTAASA